ncbi:MAG: hypothetical protein ACYDHP_13175 [Ferrimicrobium sp.]
MCVGDLYTSEIIQRDDTIDAPKVDYYYYDNHGTTTTTNNNNNNNNNNYNDNKFQWATRNVWGKYGTPPNPICTDPLPWHLRGR